MKATRQTHILSSTALLYLSMISTQDAEKSINSIATACFVCTVAPNCQATYTAALYDRFTGSHITAGSSTATGATGNLQYIC